jgi:hypothetical protein
MNRLLTTGAFILVGAGIAGAVVGLTQADATTGGLPARSPLRHPIISHTVNAKWLQDGPTILGDTVAVQVAETDKAGHAVGTNDYTCTVVSLNPDKLECLSTLRLIGGSLETQAEIPRAALDNFGVPFDVPIVGGTGWYSNVHGVIRWTIDAPSVGTGIYIRTR